MEITLRGIGVSPGVAIGPACLYHVQSFQVSRHTVTDIPAEIKRLDQATEHAREDLRALIRQTEEELGERHAAIFSSHIDLLDDPAFLPEIKRRIKEENANVEFLVNDLVQSYANMMSQVEDELFRERSMDFMDVGRRVLSNLLDENIESLENLDKPCIVVANDLTPSETANMDMTNTRGLATDGGGPTSHMAILARAFEIPSVVGLRFLGRQIRQDDTLIVDGTNGFVVVRPTDSTLQHYEELKVRIEADRLALMEGTTDGPAQTLDGTEIHTLANIELLAETQNSLKAKCQGIGLYRTEFLFMNRASLPGEDEQYHSYRKVIEAMSPLPVTMRTLDLGGDKLIPSLYREKEGNPQLGWRSIRMCLDRPDIFKAQLRALLRASVYGPMQIMFPMITGIDQFREAKQVLEEVKDDLTARHVEFAPDVPVGAMVEVPAAVAVADKLAEESDFFSIGTNDLIQYCLAVDRVNERTAHLYEPTHMGVLRLIKQTLDAAKDADIPCTICGEMAGDPMLTELLLGMGAQSLSMTGASLPMVRAEIANTKMPAAKRLARKVLDLGSASEIRALLQDRYEQRGTIKLYRDRQG